MGCMLRRVSGTKNSGCHCGVWSSFEHPTLTMVITMISITILIGIITIILPIMSITILLSVKAQIQGVASASGF